MSQATQTATGDIGAAKSRRLAARIGAFACLVCCVLAVGEALFPGIGLDRFAVGFLLLYIVSEPRKVLPSQWAMGLLLIACGIALSAMSGKVASALWEGGRGTLMFILLFASVTLLQYPAIRSPSMQVVRIIVTNLPPGRRYLWLSLASHFLSAITNFAGFALLASFVASSAAGELRKRMALALSRGFVAASTWSPFFLAMAVVVSLMPTLRWVDVAAPGILLGLLLIVFGAVCDRFGRRGETVEEARVPVVIEGKQAAMLKLLALSLILVGGVAAFDAIAHLSMSATISIVVTVFSLGWFLILAATKTPGVPGVNWSEYGSSLIDNVGGLRGLSVLFIAANIFGQGVSSAVDGHMLVAAASKIGVSGVLWIPFLMFLIAGTSILGLHSVIMIVIIGHTLPPAAIGLSQQTMALMMLASWGIGGVLSPLSNLTLYASNMLGQSNWSMAWLDNGFYAFGCIVISSVVIIGFHMMQGGAL